MLLVSVSDTCGAVLYSADKDKRILSASYDFLNCSAALLKPNSALQYSVIALIINPSVSFITFTPSFFISALQAAIQSFISSVIFSLVLLIRSAARIFSVNVVVSAAIACTLFLTLLLLLLRLPLPELLHVLCLLRIRPQYP